MSERREDHMLHVLFLKTIMAANTLHMKVLNQRKETLKEEAVADLTKYAFYQNHFNADTKYLGGKDTKNG